MAKLIKYKFLSCEVNHGTEENPDIEQIFLDKFMGWNETNEETAKREAYNGEYSIVDDGQPEPEAPLTDAERIAELEEALDMLLNGVTE
jgi:hypothetical protein